MHDDRLDQGLIGRPCGVASGWVTGIARPVHIGRSTQVWQIDMTDDEGRISCVSRLTMSVLAPR